MLLYLEQGDYLTMYKQLTRKHEVGGYFKLNGNRLIPVYSSSGNSNSINMNNSSKFLFHSHPGRCVDKKNCSLGMPSSTDMAQIVQASSEGNIVHFVVAHEGLYLVQVRCDLVQTFNQNPQIKEQIKNEFKQFQNQFSNSSESYDNFINNWIQFANQNGFHVLYYPHGSALQFELNPPCHF